MRSRGKEKGADDTDYNTFCRLHERKLKSEKSTRVPV
jgi:hypothetical protein